VNRLRELLKTFVSGQSGAVAIEYVLIASAMGIAIIAAMPGITSAWQASIGNVASYFP
jgi:Flp pilus assembly pilin Flp